MEVARLKELDIMNAERTPLIEKFAAAFDAQDIASIASIVEALRIRGLNYSAIYDIAKRAYPVLTPADWDAVLYQCDFRS